MGRTAMIRSRRRTMVVLALAGLTLLLAGPATAQQPENVLNVGKYAQLSTYDPHAGPLDTLWWTGNNFYESLLDLGDDIASLRSVLATSWTVSRDGKTYTFK